MKSYFRFAPTDTYGIICSPSSNVVFDNSGKLAISGSLDRVSLWNLRQSNEVAKLTNDQQYSPYSDIIETTTLHLSKDNVLCAGYTNGMTKLYKVSDQSVIATFHGHKSTIHSLSTYHDNTQSLLATGSADCSVIIWDLVARRAITRLKGHQDAVTSVVFLPIRNPDDDTVTLYLITASKDTLMKVWDLTTMSCVQTVVGHRAEIWSLRLFSGPQSSTGVDNIEDSRLFTGSSDEFIRVYSINAPKGSTNKDGNNDSTNEDSSNQEILSFSGSIARSTHDRCLSLEVNASKTLLSASSAGKVVDFYQIVDKQTLKKRRKRKAKQQIQKTTNKGTNKESKETSTFEMMEEDDEEEDEDDQNNTSTGNNVTDELKLLYSLRVPTKIRSFSFAPYTANASKQEDVALLASSSNYLELYKVKNGEAFEVTKSSIIDLQGHRSDVRGINISADNNTIATCASDSIKFWSARNGQCIGSCLSGQSSSGSSGSSDYFLSLAFAPGGRFLLVGSKAGALLLVDIASGEVIQRIDDAHEGAIWSICVRPDGNGFMTGSADKYVKFWNFEVSSKGLKVDLHKQLLMPSDVLCVKYSNSRSRQNLLVAVALLDSSIKLFFEDTLKLFLTLYGHKLPVMSIDISYDNTILVSGSADKTVKIWGLDFGDCHRSLIAHNDTVTSVRFQPHTHFFFSGGKDGVLKYWDADRFEQVLHLSGHKGAIWAMDVSSDGADVFTCGQDRSLRRWGRTEDLVFVEEEKERMLEAQIDKAAIENEQDRFVSSFEQDGVTTTNNGAVMAKDNAQVAVAASAESIRSGEILMDAIDQICSEVDIDAMQGATVIEQRAMIEALLSSSKNPLMLGRSPVRHFVWALRLIKQPDLESVLLALPFYYVKRIVVLLVQTAKHGLELEMCCRCAVFLLRCHQSPLTGSGSGAILNELVALRDVIVQAIDAYRTMIGTNIAGLKWIEDMIQDDQDAAEAIPMIESKPKKK